MIRRMLSGPDASDIRIGWPQIISKTTLSGAIMSRSSYVQVCSRATDAKAVSQIVPRTFPGNGTHESSMWDTTEREQLDHVEPVGTAGSMMASPREPGLQ